MRAHQRRRFVAVSVVLVVLVNVLAVMFVIPGDEPLPLELGLTELRWVGNTAAISAPVHNEGDSPVELLSASVPGVPAAKVQRPTGETYLTERDAWVPVAGRTLPPGDSEWLDIVVPARCPNVPAVKTLAVRVRVDGREATQTLALPKVAAGQCR